PMTKLVTRPVSRFSTDPWRSSQPPRPPTLSVDSPWIPAAVPRLRTLDGLERFPQGGLMPAKRSTRFTVKHFAKQVTKHFAMKNFGMKHFTVKRPMAIGIIVVCIFGTAMLIVARSSEPTTAASIFPQHPILALPPLPQP